MIRPRTASMSSPVERSITVSAPCFTAGKQFFQLAGGVAGNGRLADVRVDLRPRGDADADRLETLLQMHLIGRNDHPPAATSSRTNSGRALRLGDVLHFGRDGAGFGLFKLSHRLSLTSSGWF